VIAGISLNGTEFFYLNPLEADGKYAFNQGACTRQWAATDSLELDFPMEVRTVEAHPEVKDNAGMFKKIFFNNLVNQKLSLPSRVQFLSFAK
jgi:DUF1680 family protein